MYLVTTILFPILLVIIPPRGTDKLPEAGAHREISRFPGGPVRLWCPVRLSCILSCFDQRSARSNAFVIRLAKRLPARYYDEMIFALLLRDAFICRCDVQYVHVSVQCHLDARSLRVRRQLSA